MDLAPQFFLIQKLDMSILKNKTVQQILLAILAIIFGAGGGAGVVSSGIMSGAPDTAELITPGKDLGDIPRLLDPTNDLETGEGDAAPIYDYIVFCNCQYNYFRATVPFKEGQNNIPVGQGYTDLNNNVVAVPLTTRKVAGVIDKEFMNSLQACGPPTTAIVSSVIFTWKQRTRFE